MNEKELIENWRDQKLSHNFWRLRAGRIIESSSSDSTVTPQAMAT